MKNYKQIPEHVTVHATITMDGETETKEMTGLEYNNIISWIPLLRSVGGSETIRYEYYCKYGYKVVKSLVSRSPSGKVTKYVFKF